MNIFSKFSTEVDGALHDITTSENMVEILEAVKFLESLDNLDLVDRAIRRKRAMDFSSTADNVAGYKLIERELLQDYVTKIKEQLGELNLPSE